MLNAAFGLEIMLEGTPRGKVVPVRIVWRYPDPGLQNPQTGKTKFVDDYMDRREISKKSTFYWMLGQEWALVPGTWIFELWYENRALVRQSFRLERE